MWQNIPMETLKMKTRIARELERRIESGGWTKRRLSLKAGLSESAVKKIIGGESHSPRHDTLARLARTLGCRVAELTGEEDVARPHEGHLIDEDVLARVIEGMEVACHDLGIILTAPQKAQVISLFYKHFSTKSDHERAAAYRDIIRAVSA